MGETRIHPTAVVASGAELGPDVEVGPFAVIADHVRIGEGCRIGPHVVIHSFTTLGPRCRVHAGAVLGDLPQDVAFRGGESFVEIGADCVIREGVTIHRGTRPGTATVVGDGCYLMAFSHLAHNVRLGKRVTVVNGALLAGYVEVGDGAFLSGNCLVHQFTRIGRLAMLGGGAAVSKDVPPFCTARSASLNRILGLNVVGMRRAGMPAEARLQVKRAFHLLYRSGLNIRAAAARIREEFPDGPAREMADFVAASRRGICAFRETAENFAAESPDV